MTHEISLSELKEAIVLIDNEALRLRDQINKTGEDSDKIEKIKLYKLKERMLDILEKQRLFYSIGYYRQKRNGKEYKVFINELRHTNDDKTIYTIKRYKRRDKTNQSPVKCKGEIGLMESQDLKSNLGLTEAIKLIERYITIVDIKYKKHNKENKNNEVKNDKENKNDKVEKTVKHSKIKETKLVELSRLRVVRDIHIKGQLNALTTKQKKEELIKKISENKGKYPKEKAILVHKSKDPEDKRKVIYNIEDGYRRYLLAGELGLDKVYVNIIDE